MIIRIFFIFKQNTQRSTEHEHWVFTLICLKDMARKKSFILKKKIFAEL